NLEITTDQLSGNASTTTTVIDSKNGSVPKSPGKVLKRTVTEDIVTTFSSPAAWLLVIALIITWSAVAVVMFDLVDYKNFSASSIAKIGSDPLKLVHDAVEETTDWIYGFFSLLSDIISSDADEEDDDGDEDTDKGEIEEPPLRKKEIHKDKTEKQEKPERKIQTKESIVSKSIKMSTHKEKIEKKEKPETKTMAKEEKKTKTAEKSEDKTKKEVKGGKQEKVKQTAAKGKEVQKTPSKPKEKEDKEKATVSKHEQKDQYAFCRYMIDMFVHGDLKPGQSPAIPPPLLREQASSPTPASPALEVKQVKTYNFLILPPEKEDVKKKSEKETAVDVEKKEPGKAPETKQGTIKITAQETERAKEEVGAVSSKKAVPGKKEEKTTKTVEQEIRKEKSGKTSSVLKDKEPIKGKGEKIPASLKEKEPETKKDEKMSKAGKEVKPKPPRMLYASSKCLKNIFVLLFSEQDIVKPEKTVSHGKPGILQVVFVISHSEHQEREPPFIKTGILSFLVYIYLNSVFYIRKLKQFSTRKESLQLHNVTKEEDVEEVPASKKAKGPISFFQCVYLDEYNGYGFQFPFTPAHRPGESSGQANSPGQKQQRQ
uniref:Triadin n=1 Tax=Saimiri boliviensis boliviensis TaxID=39432 RepID=A0A2K6RY42_SAIBB